MPSVDPPPPPKEKFRGERGGRRVKKQKALQKKVEEGKYVPKVFNPKLKVPGGVDSKRQLCCDSVEAVEVVSGSGSSSDKPKIVSTFLPDNSE